MNDSLLQISDFQSKFSMLRIKSNYFDVFKIQNNSYLATAIFEAIYFLKSFSIFDESSFIAGTIHKI